MQELHYRIRWRATGLIPGAHRGSQGGPGLEFRHHAPLLAAADPRRLDILGSLRDPLRRWLVRVPYQLSAVPVTLLADLSASMGSGDGVPKLDVMADLAAALGHSAWKTGDRFAFYGCDEDLRADFTLPAARARATALELAARLRVCAPAGRSAAGLLQAARHLGGARGLVFVASDWHFPVAFAARVLDALARHDVVPVVIGEPAPAAAQTAAYGARWLTDAESGRRRLVLMRPALAARIAARRERHAADLAALFRRRGRRPLRLSAGFSAAAVNRYFAGGEA